MQFIIRTIRHVLFIFLSVMRGIVLGILKLITGFCILGVVVFAIFGNLGGPPLMLSAIPWLVVIAIATAMLSFWYDRLVLALQPKGSDIILIR